jgi:hypothetical protein
VDADVVCIASAGVAASVKCAAADLSVKDAMPGAAVQWLEVQQLTQDRPLLATGPC